MKVGDKVKILRVRHGLTGVKVGDVGVIREVQENGPGYLPDVLVGPVGVAAGTGDDAGLRWHPAKNVGVIEEGAPSCATKEVLVIGSGGVWAKGPTLDDAYAKAASHGPLGRKIIVVVAPAEVGIEVDSYGGIVWSGSAAPRHVYIQNGDKLEWPNRRTAALRSAVSDVMGGV